MPPVPPVPQVMKILKTLEENASEVHLMQWRRRLRRWRMLYASSHRQGYKQYTQEAQLNLEVWNS